VCTYVTITSNKTATRVHLHLVYTVYIDVFVRFSVLNKSVFQVVVSETFTAPYYCRVGISPYD